jgi:Putative metal-binding motif
MTTISNNALRTHTGRMLIAVALTAAISGCTLSTDFGGYTFSPATDGGSLDAPQGNGNVDSGIAIDTLPSCTPTTEVCNGLDDDCNGTTDENLGSTTCGMGTCIRTVDNCFAGAVQTCTAGTPEPAELCNGLDDDCNGTTDEALGTTTCGKGICSRTVDNCIAGAAQICTAGLPVAESCNGLDDDCNGDTDETLGTTTCGTGVCSRTVNNCAQGAPQVCAPGPAAVETCNGLDDDCNGDTDEALGTTTCGTGVCTRTVKNCEGGLSQVCTPGQASREICGDALDNDCDGSADRVPLLLLGDVNAANNADLASQFNAAGFLTTVIESGSGGVYQGNPSAAEFRAVVITPGDTYPVDMPQPGQQSILDAYNIRGVGVVMTEWAAYKVFSGGQWTTMGPSLAILERSSAKNGAQNYVRIVPHPVTAGLPDTALIIGPGAHNSGPAVNGGVVIMSDGTDPAIVVRDDGGKRLVHFSHSGGWTNVLWTGEPFLRQSMVNAARWAAKCEP